MMQKHSIARAVAGARWNPRDGLIGSDQGLWLDPSDLTTMFQDSAGTIPVTAVEQSVGLILDKSDGLELGLELVTNGMFDTDINGWLTDGAFTSSWSNGKARIQQTSTSVGQFSRSVSLVANTWYEVRAEFTPISGQLSTTLTLRNGSSAISSSYIYGTGAIDSNNKIVFRYFSPTNQTVYVAVRPATIIVSVYDVDNISVRKLPGNHALQSTSANRPTLSARYNQYVGTEAMVTQNVTTLATSYKLTFSGAGSITLSGTATGTYTAGTYTVTCTAGTLTSTVSGSVTQASLVQANQSSLHYQRVNTATDYDSDQTKFPRRINYAAGQSMTVSFPASLGSSCVVARANPGVSAVIAENQTVNTPLTLNTNHSGLVITSRAISVDEKARLDEYLDKKAIAK